MTASAAQPEIPAELKYLLFLKSAGYLDFKPMPEGRIACIMPLLFTHAIIIMRVGDYFGFDDRWCFHTYEAAKAALAAWDGTGEPAGFHRHPDTGRRRDEDGREYVQF